MPGRVQLPESFLLLPSECGPGSEACTCISIYVVQHTHGDGCLKVGEAEKELGGPEGNNPYATQIDEAGGLDRIEQLQNHTAEDIYEKAVSILEVRCST